MPKAGSVSLTPRVRSILLPLSAAFLFGSGIPVLRWLTEHCDIVLLGALRMFAAAVSLMWWWRGRSNKTSVSPRDLMLLAACAVLMSYLNQLLFVGGLSRTSATNASLISAMNPIAAAIVAFLVGGERLSAQRSLGVLLGLCGVALVVLQRPGAAVVSAGFGDLMILGAIFLYAFGALLLQRLSTRLDVTTITVFIHAIGCGFLILQTGATWAWTGETPRMPTSALVWLMVILAGAVFTGLPNLLFNRSIASIGMARAVTWLYWTPIAGMAVAVMFLGEPLTIWHFFGLMLVFSGTWLGSRRSATVQGTST